MTSKLTAKATKGHAATLSDFEHARDAATTADVARDDAQHAFDRTGTEAALDALDLAQTGARRAQLHLGRATRLHEESEAQLARCRREGLREEASEVDEHLTRNRILERALPLAEAEARALVALHEARIARGALAHELRGEVRRRRALARDLDEPFTLSDSTHDILAVGPRPVEQIIKQMGYQLRDLAPSALELLRTPRRGRRGA